MKKYTSVLSVFFLLFTLLVGFNSNTANAQAVCIELDAGATLRVTGTGNLRVRNTPSLDGVRRGAKPARATGTFTGVAPVSADGYCWVKVEWSDVVGWSVTQAESTGLEIVTSSPGGSSAGGSTGGGSTGGSLLPAPCTPPAIYHSETGQPCTPTNPPSGSGGSIAPSTVAGFSINKTGDNTVTVIPVCSGSYDCSGSTVDGSEISTFWNAEGAGTGFNIDVVDGPAEHYDSFTGSTVTCQAPRAANNTMFVYVGGPKPCSASTTDFVVSRTNYDMAHEFGHALGLADGSGSIMSSGPHSFSQHLLPEQRTTLGWTTGGDTPPPTGGTGQFGTICPTTGTYGRTCNAPIRTNNLATFALTCPASPVQISRGGTRNVYLTAVGTYSASAPVDIPRGAATGFRVAVGAAFGVYIPVAVATGGPLNVPINVSGEVSLGLHTVPIQARVTNLVPGGSEPAGADLFSGCNMKIEVTDPGQPVTEYGRISTTVGAYGVPVQEISVQTGNTVPIQWSSAGVSSCRLEVNGTRRALSGTSGNFTSDPVRANYNDTYKIICVNSRTGQEITSDSTGGNVLTVSSTAPIVDLTSGQLSMTFEARGSTQPYYGIVPKDSLGRAIEFVHVGSGGTVQFSWNTFNGSSCNILRDGQPTVFSGTSGSGGIGGVESPFELKLNCIGTSGEQKSKVIRVVLNPGEAVTGELAGSLSCTPYGQFAFIGSRFPVRTITTSTVPGRVGIKVNVISGIPRVRLVSDVSGSFVAGVNDIIFEMYGDVDDKVRGSRVIITAADSQQNEIGSCEVGVNWGTIATSGIVATPQNLTLTAGSSPVIVELSGGTPPYRIGYGAGEQPNPHVANVVMDGDSRVRITPLGAGSIAPRVYDNYTPPSTSTTPDFGDRATSIYITVVGAGGGTPPAQSAVYPGAKVVTTTAVNLRSTAGGPVIRVVPTGTPATITGYSVPTPGGYQSAQVRTTTGTGYIDTRFMKVVGDNVVTPTGANAGANANAALVAPTASKTAPGVVLSDRPTGTTVNPTSCPLGTKLVGLTASLPPSYICEPITTTPPTTPPAITPAPLPPSSVKSTPVISSLSPASGVVGTSVTLRGTNLASTTTVNFGSGVVSGAISSDGSVTFQVPSAIDPACATLVPACALPSTQVVAGSYEVSVSNAGGKSNTLSFQVTAGTTVAPTDVKPIAPTTTTPTCSATGYDTKTGFKCGCTGTTGYSKTTGLSCAVSTSSKVLGASAYTFTQPLQLGSTGSEVTQLQIRLNTLGYDAGVTDGTFGSQTQSAVVKLQLANGLTADGAVGPQTRLILNK